MKKKTPLRVKNDISKLLSDLDNDPERLRQILTNSLLLIYDVLEIVNTWSNDSRFIKFITEEFQIDNLIEKGIIDLEHHKGLLEANGIFLNKTELELSCLSYYGFSTHLLSRIYGHNNTRSIHVRNFRLRTKIREQMALEHEEEEKEKVFDF